MSSVVMNEEGLRELLYSPTGPLGLYIDYKAREVETYAHNNVTGRPGPNIRSARLIQSIRYGGPPIVTADGPLAVIGTDARSPRQNFNYPAALEIGMPEFARLPFVERNGRATTHNTGRIQKGYRYPFLGPALKSAFGKA